MGKLGLLQCRLATQTHDLEQPFEVIIGWHENGEGGKDNDTSICDKKEVTLDEPFEKSFRLPLPNAKITEPMMLRIARMFGEKTTKVSRLEVRGRLAPMFGMEVDEKSGSVFAKKVASNGLGKKAGLQVGDIIMTINGKKPTTRSEAVDMLSLLPVGEEAVFTIQRADKTQELRVVAE
jgi:predicted metalloprotease with PDZ domain